MPSIQISTRFLSASFALVLAGFVFFGQEVLTERIPGGDEGRAQGVVHGHERFEFRAGLDNMHHERGFVMQDIVGLRECLGHFTWNHLAHDTILSKKAPWRINSQGSNQPEPTAQFVSR